MFHSQQKNIQRTFQIKIDASKNVDEVVQTASQVNLNQYKNFMEIFPSKLTRDQIINQLAAHNIRYTQQINEEEKSINLTILKHNSSWSCLLVKLQYYNFETELSVLDVGQRLLNILQNKDFHFYGGFGKIYIFQDQKRKIALKLMKFFNKQKVLSNIIIQFFFNLLFDALDCGPALSNCSGFDILISQNHAMFFMQYSPQSNNKLISQKDLVQQLNILHSLQIIHGDIKPDNILYSESKKKYVFCDFGLTKIIDEKIGWKTKTYFAGSLSYVSPQMALLFEKQIQQKQHISQFINLYYNDFYALRETLKGFLLAYQEQNQFEFFKEPDFFVICQIKFDLFQNKSTIQMIPQDYIAEIINFVLTLTPTQYLYDFVTKQLGVSRNDSFCHPLRTKLSDIYMKQGIKIENFQKYNKKFIPNIFLFMKRIQKNSPSFHLQQLISLIKKQTNDKLKICRWYICLLNHWKSNKWVNIQRISQIVHMKLYQNKKVQLFQDYSVEFISDNSYQKITKTNHQPNNSNFILCQKVIPYSQPTSTSLTDKQILENNLKFCENIFIQANDYVHLIHLAYFFYYFLIEPNKYFDTILTTISILKKQQNEQGKLQIVILNAIVTTITPLQSAIMENYRWITDTIKMLIPMPQNSQFLSEIIYYKQALDQIVYQKLQINQIHLPSLKISQNSFYFHYYQTIRLCLQSRFYLFQDDYKSMSNCLNLIEKKIVYLDFETQYAVKKFVKFCYLHSFYSLRNQRAIILLQQITTAPKSYVNIWNSVHIQFFMAKYSLLRRPQEAYKYLIEFLSNPAYFFAYKIFVLVQEIENILVMNINKHSQFFQIYNNWLVLIHNTYLIQDSFTLLRLLLIQIAFLECRFISIKDIQKTLAYIQRFDQCWLPKQKAKLIFFKLKIFFAALRFKQVLQIYQLNRNMLIQDKKLYIKSCIIVSQAKAYLNLKEDCYTIAQYCYQQMKFSGELTYGFSQLSYVYILLKVFSQKKQNNKFLQLFDSFIRLAYLNRRIKQMCFVPLIQKNVFLQFKEKTIFVSLYYLKENYYLSKNIELHGASAVIIEVVDDFVMKKTQKLKILRKIAMTILSLSLIRYHVQNRYYKLIHRYVKGRKAFYIRKTKLDSLRQRQKRKLKTKVKLRIHYF